MDGVYIRAGVGNAYAAEGLRITYPQQLLSLGRVGTYLSECCCRSLGCRLFSSLLVTIPATRVVTEADRVSSSLPSSTPWAAPSARRFGTVDDARRLAVNSPTGA